MRGLSAEDFGLLPSIAAAVATHLFALHMNNPKAVKDAVKELPNVWENG